jgi:hypothetical protein
MFSSLLAIGTLKRVAVDRLQALFLCMSLCQNRCALLGDMHEVLLLAPRRPGAASMSPI